MHTHTHSYTHTHTCIHTHTHTHTNILSDTRTHTESGHMQCAIGCPLFSNLCFSCILSLLHPLSHPFSPYLVLSLFCILCASLYFLPHLFLSPSLFVLLPPSLSLFLSL